MRYRALDIAVGGRKCGTLFQYGEGPMAITRLKPDEDFWLDPNAPVLGWAGRQQSQRDRALFLADAAAQPFFNGTGERLPPFFQNLLPEGPLRKHLEQLRKCPPGDHMEILAMCGDDLPGNVYAVPTEDGREGMEQVVTQGHDALEMSVIDAPLAGATSLSGIQPKLGLIESAGRYVARTRENGNGVHIIAKLPTGQYALLPEVEELSLRLARAAGVTTCDAALKPVSDILPVDQPYTIEEGLKFLAVKRFDRSPQGHIHCEDFAQVLSIDPDSKYSDPNANYAAMLFAMGTVMGMSEDEQIEVLRRLMVNEMLGNYDAHVKNFGVIYRDGVTPELSPAYDVVAYGALLKGTGHGLAFFPGGPKHAQLTPALVRELCGKVGMLETRVRAALGDAVQAARQAWPQMIEESLMLPAQKQKLIEHFDNVPAVIAQAIRRTKSAKRAGPGYAT